MVTYNHYKSSNAGMFFFFGTMEVPPSFGYKDNLRTDCNMEGETVRHAYERMERTARLIKSGFVVLDADIVANKPGNLEIFDLIASHYGLHADQRPALSCAPFIDVNPFNETSIVEDWLTEAYADEYGLEHGETASIDDLAHFYAMNYAGDYPPPFYLAGVIQMIDEESAETDEGDYDGFSHHIGFIPY